MSKRKTVFLPGHYYHVFNRGTNRMDIFRNAENYDYLLRLIKKNVAVYDITMVAYCLMPNHYHFLLRQKTRFSISNCIQSIFNAYTKAFNKMTRRTGTLFESRFKSVSVDSKKYLMYLCRYIHRNPIDGRHPLVEKIEDWLYSNYPDWIGLRQGTLIDRKLIAGLFKSPSNYIKFISETPSPGLLDRLDKYLFDD
jgi:putative transposase